MEVILPVKQEIAVHPLSLIYNTPLVFFILTLKSQEKNWAIYTNLPRRENI